MNPAEVIFLNAISRRRAAQNLPKKEFELFERSEFLNSRQIRAAQGSPAFLRDQVNGCTFFGSFLYASKEMNIKKNYISICLVTLLVAILLFAGSAKGATGRGELRVAVATNFIRAMDVIADHFQKQTGISVKRSSSASGVLYAQIVNNGPYDLFFSADEKRPELLFRQGLCEEPFTYAIGEVVLWSGRSDLDTTKKWDAVVLQDDVRRIAMANPATAPYGEAAVKALNERGIQDKVKGRLVYGLNVGQAFQYAGQGAADIAFTARSYALSDPGRRGETWNLPEAPPVIQNGCILNRSAHRKSAREFAAYLKTAEAKSILATFGYR